MVELDAKGLSCPRPLMMAQEALESHPGEQVVIWVDSASPRDNILRMVRKRKLAAEVTEEQGAYRITIG